MKSRITLFSLMLFLVASAAMGQGNKYYVAANAEVDSILTATSSTSSSDGYGQSWSLPMKLTEALVKVVAGDYVFVKGYNESFAKTDGTTNLSHVYTVPSSSSEVTYDSYTIASPTWGFVLKSGVKLYGGFSGRETNAQMDGFNTTVGTSSDPRSFSDGKRSRLTYRSVLNADIEGNDKVDEAKLIYFGSGTNNFTRSDNANHVLTVQLGAGWGNANNVNNAKTVVNGFSIVGGATWYGGAAANYEVGAGIRVVNGTGNPVAKGTGDAPFEISQCFFTNNYAMGGGAAIYVDATATNEENLVNLCSMMNNVAATRGKNVNLGAGIYAAGHATIANCVVYNNVAGGVLLSGTTKNASKLINCTVARNTVAAIDVVDGDDTANPLVANSAFWGNTALSASEATRPVFHNCAYYGVKATMTDGDTLTDDNKNVPIVENNTVENGAYKERATYFENPSHYTSFDRTYDWRTAYPYWSWFLDERSALVARGSLEYYDTGKYGLMGLGGTERINTFTIGGTEHTIIDIGACEHEQIVDGRRLYVAEDGDDGNDGLSWAKPKRNIQSAINALVEASTTQRGEVWVKAGHYSPTQYIDGSNTNSPVSIRMYEGISLFGGFKGNETRKRDREIYGNNMPWAFKNESFISAADFKSDDITYGNDGWNVQSGSTHVVWFAPLPDAEGNVASFDRSTRLDGFTIEGGVTSSSTTSDMAMYHPSQGAGVYMVGKAYLDNCVVRHNVAISFGGTEAQGGGIYSCGGQVTGTLVYNNAARDGQGGGVFLLGDGLFARGMIANNFSGQGGGIYCNYDASVAANRYYNVVTSSVISNNTNTENGAVYMNGGGVVEQNTIVNNYTARATDVTESRPSKTGGLYIVGYATVINNILWNNLMKGTGITESSEIENASAVSKAQAYALNPATVDGASAVKFYNNAMSDKNFTSWNGLYQSSTVEMDSRDNGSYFDLSATAATATTPNLTTYDQLNTLRGVQSGWGTVNFYWPTLNGTTLCRTGLHQGLFPSEVLLKPDLDVSGQVYSDMPTIGAYETKRPQIIPSFTANHATTTSGKLRIYIESALNNPKGDGSTWADNYQSCNDAMAWLATLAIGSEVTVQDSATALRSTHKVEAQDEFEIVIREGDLHPRYTYSNYDPRSSTMAIPATVCHLSLVGGYPSYTTKLNPTDADRNPITYRSDFNGNNGGTSLADAVYHVMRVAAGANVTLDGYAVTDGYADGSASIPRGGGMLIATGANVTLRNCIFENNTGVNGSAIAVEDGATGVKLAMQNCVVNNNTCTTATNNVVEMGTGNTLSLTHCSFINNVGTAPASLGSTSFAAGNITSPGAAYLSKQLDMTDTSDKYYYEAANNTLTLATIDAEGAKNFKNPSKVRGAVLSANSYYGNEMSYRPLTSSTATADIINKVAAASEALSHDIEGDPRTLGGAADLGAYEAILPRAGKVIYVRSYNTVSSDQGEEIDGAPEMLDLAGSSVYDGSTWSQAINGNAICDVKEARSGNDFYVKSSGKMLPTTSDSYTSSYGMYGPSAGCYADFFASGSGNEAKSAGSSITNNRNERYISGLQYAVEMARMHNAQHPGDSVEVWVGSGIYTDFKGFVIRDSVKVYGGFPSVGNPGEGDRVPLLSKYIPSRDTYANLAKSDYETILQIRKETPVTWSGNTASPSSTFNALSGTQRHPVLYQPDVCLPTWDPRGNNSNTYRYPTSTESDMLDKTNYKEYNGSPIWNGFTVRHGYLKGYVANRDGGAGVRVFRGVDLANLVIVNNYTSYSGALRGGGLYMDGKNSRIYNSYIYKNAISYGDASGDDGAYGGGAYMIVGTGYNLVVANNCAIGTHGYGGGLFVESATFFNNTVAYNRSAGEGSGIEQWADKNSSNRSSKLQLYNCIVYGNEGGSAQIYSRAIKTFENPHNNYVQKGGIMEGLISKFEVDSLNNIIDNSSSPFASSDPQGTNDYRLNSTTKCLNGGTQTGINLPSTDIDYTDRVKDCEVDIGAYEHDNTANAKGDTSTDPTRVIFYVTQNGAGTMSGESLNNAACAEKLQRILNKAGEVFKANQSSATEKTKTVVVKVAGYNQATNPFVYHANTLAYADDPQSYTYVIPNGVTLMGGYAEPSGASANWQSSAWADDTRNAYDECRTILSARHASTDVNEQDITGYHTVTFGEWPVGASGDGQQREDWTDLATDPFNLTCYNEGVKSAQGQDWIRKPAVPDSAIIDGVWLEDGQATEAAGHKSMGGGAIVVKNAHMRNCVVTGCSATQGGGLMLLQGGKASGCLITENTATQGGGVYASNVNYKGIATGDSAQRAFLVSSTLIKNTATKDGGGIYYENGSAMMGNDVIWGNLAASDNNVCGIVTEKYYTSEYALTSDPSQQMSTLYFYPFNDCFVENYQMPANTSNHEMTSDQNTYFASSSWKPRTYSALVHKGIKNIYQRLWQRGGVSPHDICGQTRIVSTAERLTGGCFAIVGGQVSTSKLITRLFVSQEGGEEVSDAVRSEYVGCSFYTPFNSLDAALAYIQQVRQPSEDGNGKTVAALATVDTHFDILMAGGIYKPSTMRSDAASTTVDQRNCSFSIPVNVSIYGSFNADDKFSSHGLENITTLNGALVNLTCTTDGDNNELAGGSMKEILKTRNLTSRFDDANNNDLLEPWGFVSQTILSGDIQASEKEKTAYHVVYSSKTTVDKLTSTTTATSGTTYADAQGNHYAPAALRDTVLLDGLTIINGESSDYIDVDENGDEKHDEVGHGAGIYSDGVNYILNRCRVRNNTAVHGGGIYVKDANLTVVGSLFNGNRAIAPSNADKVLKDTLLAKGLGGAVCLSGDVCHFYAVHSIFANNTAGDRGVETSTVGEGEHGQGGAIAVLADPQSDNGNTMELMNCLVVRNVAAMGPAVYTKSQFASARNTAIWGNQGNSFLTPVFAYYCASDLPNFSDSNNKERESRHNVQLSRDNMGLSGPRFKRPTSRAGAWGYDSKARWEPASISVLTESGDGYIDYKDNEALHGGNALGGHADWWYGHQELADYADEYIFRTTDGDASTYHRYSGPVDSLGHQGRKTIDIGMYEYQHHQSFNSMNAVYIGTEERGTGSGDSWSNQSTDLYGAIVALARATDGKDTERTIYVRDGEYFSPTLNSTKSAFPLTLSDEVSGSQVITEKLVIRGACTGSGSTQDFSNQTVLTPNPSKAGTSQLLSVQTGGKEVRLEGLTTYNVEGDGVRADVNATGGVFTMANCGLRQNGKYGVNIADNRGKLLIYNTVFANNRVAGLHAGQATEKATLVNTTFGRNVVDITTNGIDHADIYNTVTWSDSTQHTANIAEAKGHFNCRFEPGAVAYNNVVDGPNFVDPDAYDYDIMPSIKLYGTGDPTLYEGKVGVAPANDVDRASEKRLVGDSIDIGAYEYQLPLQQIIYVKQGAATDGDGKSWTTPIRSLQSAIDLAGVYSQKNTTSTSDGNQNYQYGYVFVDRGVRAQNVNVQLPGVKVYGSFNNETTTATNAADVAKELLKKRGGVIERDTATSTISGLKFYNENVEKDNYRTCLDGFIVKDSVNIANGVLATSVVDAYVDGVDGGTLYNSLVLGKNADGLSVNKAIRTINVTAVGNILSRSDDAKAHAKTCNNYPNASVNKYVSARYWNYQLNDDDTDKLNQVPCTHDKDKAPDGQKDQRYSNWWNCYDLVDHDQDLAGNRRFRDNLDYGCFETWDVGQLKDTVSTNQGKTEGRYWVNGHGIVKDDDYPHGRSVIYVRKDNELKLEKAYASASPLTPGFLLLEHHAGLRGCGNAYTLASFAVERNLVSGKPDMVSIPFYVNTENTVNRDKFSVKRYRGGTRADFDFKWGTNTAWAPYENYRSNVNEGVLLELNDDVTDATEANPVKARFYGGAEGGYGPNHIEGITYVDPGNGKGSGSASALINLTQYNNEEEWPVSYGTTKKFTHKENMGWNLFGSPFLCAMNYDEMEYGRVVYAWDVDHQSYRTINTAEATSGYIPAFDAVFTQTAVLTSQESVNVSVPSSDGKKGAMYEGNTDNVDIIVTRSAATRGEAEDGSLDVLSLRAVPAADARADFDMGTDGVKWMTSTSAPLIYAEQNGGRYSLLSAVSVEGTLAVGVTLPEDGTYTIAIPEACDVEAYEAIMLHDALTGQSVDLARDDYDFTAEAGDVTTRFTLTFRRGSATDEPSAISIRQVARATIRVSGTEQGDVVRVYTVAGVLASEAVATGYELTLPTHVSGAALIEVSRAATPLLVRKMAVK